ncbi:MAG TPA: hypothetical protein VG537_04680 [Candidatus Kapabacteria bacterium]|jgi:hypothetical protein|nr:hypothetical protein [Candidatus Kapabacteria bacterium]
MCEIDWTAIGTWVIALVSLGSTILLKRQLKESSETFKRQALIDREKVRPVFEEPNTIYEASNGQVSLILMWHYYQPQGFDVDIINSSQADIRTIEIIPKWHHSYNIIDAHAWGTSEIVIGSNISTTTSLQFEMNIRYSDIFGNRYVQPTKFFNGRWYFSGASSHVSA